MILFLFYIFFDINLRLLSLTEKYSFAFLSDYSVVFLSRLFAFWIINKGNWSMIQAKNDVAKYICSVFRICTVETQQLELWRETKNSSS